MIEISARRSATAKHFELPETMPDGRPMFKMHAHVGHIHYFNKLGVGDGQVRWREIDWTLEWDDDRQGWGFEFHSFQPFIPKFADEWVEFRDLFDEKDQTVRYRAQCAHVEGRIVMPDEIGLGRMSGVNAVIYDDAFGPGQDYVIYFTRSAMVKCARIRTGTVIDGDAVYEWEFDDGNMEIVRGAKEDPAKYVLDQKRAKVFDTPKLTRLGEERSDGKEGQTYLRPFFMWDDKRLEPVQVEYDLQGKKKLLRKTVPAAFIESATGDVFTDTTTTIYAGAGDGYVGNSGGTWATVRSATDGNGFDYTTAFHDNQFQTYKSGGTYIIWRAFYPCDMSSIGSGFIPTAAALRIYCEGRTQTDVVSWHLVETSQALNTQLANADYDAFVNTSLGSQAVGSMVDGTYSTFNCSDLTKINLLGFTKLGLISSLDLNDIPPTGANFWISQFSEATGTSNDPYYDLTYTVVPPIIRRTLANKIAHIQASAI